jgi:predicted nucleotidyltransferase
MKFFHNNNEYELIVLNLAGSKLYGNSTPSSDTDYRGVFIASKDSKLGILGTVEQLEGVDVVMKKFHFNISLF